MSQYNDLCILLTSHEDWLINSIISHAERIEYTRYLSASSKYWTASIHQFSRSLVTSYEKYMHNSESPPADLSDYIRGTLTSVNDLHLHKISGATLSDYINLLKQYRQSYITLIEKHTTAQDKIPQYKQQVNSLFDELEIHTCDLWHQTTSTIEPDEKAQSLFNNLIDGFAYHKIILDDNGQPIDYKFLYVNTAFEEQTGLKSKDIIDRGICEILPDIKTDEFDWIKIYGEVALTGNPQRFEQYSVALKRWYYVSAYSPEPEYFITLFTDITEQKNAEIEVRRLNRLLKTLSDINQVIVRCSDEQTLFDTVCQIAVEQGSFAAALISLVDDEGTSIDTVAKCGRENNSLITVLPLLNSSLSDAKVTWEAIQTRQHQIVNNFYEDNRLTEWYAETEKRNIQAMAAFPILCSGQCIGALRLFADTVGAFTDDDVKILNEMTSDINFALDTYEKERQRQQAELKLQETSIELSRHIEDLYLSQERFRAAFENSAVGVAIVDLNGNYLNANNSFAEIINLPVNSIIGLNVDDITHPADIRLSKKYIHELLSQNKKNCYFEKRYIKPDQSIVWCKISAALVTNKNQEPQYFVVSVQNINAEREALQSLSFEQEKLQSILNAMDDGVLIISPDYEITYANPAIRREFGDLHELKCYEYLQMSETPCANCIYSLINNRGSIHREWTHNGSLKTYDIFSTPLKQSNGQIHNLTILHDITKSKNASREIDRLYRLLLTLSDINQTIVRVKDEVTLFKAICQLAIERGKFKLATINLVTENTMHAPTSYAYSERGEGAPSSILSFDREPGNYSPTSIALQANKIQIINDIASVKSSCETWATRLMDHGYNSLAVIPFLKEDKVAGVIKLYSSEVGFFDVDELRLLEEMAGDISFALKSFDIEREKAETENTLKNTLQRLQSSMNFYLTLLEIFPNLLWRAGLDAKCDYFNPAWLNFTGRTLEEEMGDGWVEGVHPDDLDRCFQTYVTAFNKQEPFVMEYRLRYNDGTYRWIIDYGCPFNDIDGNFAGYLGSCFDIHDRKETEKELKESKERYQVLITTSPNMLMVIQDSCCTFANQAAANMLGVSSYEDLIGICPADVISSETGYLIKKWFENTQDSNQLEPLEVCITHPDQTTNWLELSAIPMTYNSTQSTLIIGQDITQLRQVADSQRLAAVGQLASGVAHDFNNILAAMLLRADLLKQLPEEHQEKALEDLLNTVVHACTRGAELCRDLMSFARPNEPQRVSTYIEEAIEAALAVAARQLENTDIRIHREYSPEKHPVAVDMGQMEQVLLNIIINACHAMADGGDLTIDTSLQEDSTGNQIVSIKISDTGIGIPPEHLSRIFEPFFTTKGRLGESDIPGTGLGLSVSHGIIEAHGGSIIVQSQLNIGTTIEIHLPAIISDDEQVVQPVIGPIPSQTVCIEGCSVLLFGDDKEYLHALSQILMQQNICTVEVNSIDEAYEELNKDRFSLVVAEYTSVVESAELLMNHLDNIPNAPGIIIITNSYQAALAERIKEKGAYDCLQRPDSLAQMVKIIASAMQNFHCKKPVHSYENVKTGKTVLVAEDEEDVRLAVRLLLETQGYQVVCMGTTQEALDILDAKTFDLIISDLMMPGGGGRKIVEAINQMNPVPPIIIITGKLEQYVVTELTELGVQAFLQKPFDLASMLKLIREILSDKS